MTVGIIHIGAHKTGSTSIQSGLRASEERLLQEDILFFNDYSRRAQLLSLAFRESNGRLLNLQAGKMNADLKRDSYAAWIGLARRVQRERPAFAIVSEEGLMWISSVGRLRSVLARLFDEIWIVAYVRCPEERFRSNLDQRIRGGATIEEIFQGSRGLALLSPKLESYSDVFGEDKVIVRNFNRRCLVGGGPVSDFQSVISNITGKSLSLQDRGVKNRSVPGAVTSFFLEQNYRSRPSFKNDRLQWTKRRKALVEYVRSSNFPFESGSINIKCEGIRGHVWGCFKEDVDSLNTRFLDASSQIDAKKCGRVMSKGEIQVRVKDWIYSYELDGVSNHLKLILDRM